MIHDRDRMPDLARHDVGAVLVTQWNADVPGRRQTKVEQMFARLERLPWPPQTISFNALVSTDGDTVLTYAQCAGEADSRFVAAITDTEPIEYRPYRSIGRDDRPVPGCIVVVSVELEGPDPQRQQRWVDTVLDAMAAETEPHPGGISAHFHLSTDGTRILNYAEWIDEDSHRDALARSGRGTVGTAPEWRAVQEFPGVKSGGFTRYRLLRSAAGSPSTGQPAHG
ncbi:antibiotic biosynthesis monooxygenase [Nonomuraea basaltis]|uniref:antibiotic biosynthesis monooxygenase n=1 Tax=Nonomuraea basaltis TaxID=2495887 RepID=UPI00110C49E8|nr:antibiotic biosynthesis monooxygenase [Nonomuraea basaltis]TMR95320.1 antibiotic biosynthesis monooxygenase [Nonomuraea basaltis]